MKLCVAGSQIQVTTDIESNVTSINRAIDFARDKKADILLTPEGSLSGYTHEFDVRAVEDALECVTSKARDSNVGLALGTCFVEPGEAKCYNQIRFYQKDGVCLGCHTKTLLCGSLTNLPGGEINHYSVRSLRTFRFSGITLGGLICNDMWANPDCTPMPDTHLSQQLSGMGARIIFHAVNGGRSKDLWSNLVWQYHESNLRMRARSGHLWIVTVDNCNPTHLCCSSPSGVISPDGNWVCRADSKGVQYFVYTIDLAG